jgi:hypothetical protein
MNSLLSANIHRALYDQRVYRTASEYLLFAEQTIIQIYKPLVGRFSGSVGKAKRDSFACKQGGLYGGDRVCMSLATSIHIVLSCVHVLSVKTVVCSLKCGNGS